MLMMVEVLRMSVGSGGGIAYIEETLGGVARIFKLGAVLRRQEAGCVVYLGLLALHK